MEVEIRNKILLNHFFRPIFSIILKQPRKHPTVAIIYNNTMINSKKATKLI